MQWRRGLRAGIAVGTIMFVCLLLGYPMGWPALGAFQVIFVDNGGPYRSRLANIITILLGGSLAVCIGVLVGTDLPAAIIATLIFCFTATLFRVLSQPFAATSVTILTSYIIAFGGANHTSAAVFTNTRDFIIGGLWAATLSLVLWPVDPFRPARAAVADVFATLAALVRAVPLAGNPERSRSFTDLIARFRTQIETAHETLAATPARMTSRTIRARNLSVLCESADLLFSRLLRFAELGHQDAILDWLAHSIAPIEAALRTRPTDGTASFAPEGSHQVDLRRAVPHLETSLNNDPSLTPEARAQLLSALHDSALSFQIAYEAVRAIWTGVEPRTSDATILLATSAALAPKKTARLPWRMWLETLQANLTLRSVMFRHALRLALDVTIDVILMYLFARQFTHYTHGYWLAMTSIIVLQPYTGETVRKSTQRVAGTIAGAVLAAVFASTIHSQWALIAVIAVGSALSVALYAVDYAWYCFFLTPTIVLLTMPHLRDWHFAAVRMGMTGLGALIAVSAMLLLWPERESLQLPSLLARATAANAGYLRAVLKFWQKIGCPMSGFSDMGSRATPASQIRQRIEAERTLLAPARRLCGLAANDAEETLDHALLEHAIPLNPERTSTERLNRAALTFTTYLRRLTQTITTLAALAEIPADANITTPQAELATTIDDCAQRLDAVSTALEQHAVLTAANSTTHPSLPLDNEQLRRLDRQVAILERTTNELAAVTQE
jgi:uncharacterized membrane protein YccC